MNKAKVYCDNCAEVTDQSDAIYIESLKFDVESANQGESAVLCPACLDEKTETRCKGCRNTFTPVTDSPYCSDRCHAEDEVLDDKPKPTIEVTTQSETFIVTDGADSLEYELYQDAQAQEVGKYRFWQAKNYMAGCVYSPTREEAIEKIKEDFEDWLAT